MAERVICGCATCICYRTCACIGAVMPQWCAQHQRHAALSENPMLSVCPDPECSRAWRNDEIENGEPDV